MDRLRRSGEGTGNGELQSGDGDHAGIPPPRIEDSATASTTTSSNTECVSGVYTGAKRKEYTGTGKNPCPAPELQVESGFCIHREIDAAADVRVDIPVTD